MKIPVERLKEVVDIVAQPLRGRSFLMEYTRPEYFPELGQKFSDPLFYQGKFSDPLFFWSKISDPLNIFWPLQFCL